jgi:hypothetical protein
MLEVLESCVKHFVVSAAIFYAVVELFKLILGGAL